MKQLLVSAVVAFGVGVGAGYLLGHEPSVDWKDQEKQMQAALQVVFEQQKAPQPLAESVSACMAGKVTSYLVENGCPLPAPSDVPSTLRVVEVCAGSAAGAFFQECLLSALSQEQNNSSGSK